MLDVARAYHARQYQVGRHSVFGAAAAGSDYILNATGASIERFAVLGMDKPMFAPAAGEDAVESFMRDVAFRGVLPDETLHRGRFAIVLEPLANGAIGRAQVAGVTVARLRVADPEQSVHHAEINHHDTAALQPAEDGSALVLWHQAPLGENEAVWAVVRLGDGATPPPIWAQIQNTSGAANGRYVTWRQVEPVVVDADGAIEWQFVAGGYGGFGGADLYEINGVERIPDNTIVLVDRNPAYVDSQTTGGIPFGCFSYPPGAYQVKINSSDDVGGYLNDKLQVGVNAGQTHTWLRKRVDIASQSGEDSDYQLRLYHGDWNENQTQVVGDILAIAGAGHFIEVLEPGVSPDPGSAWVELASWEDEYDENKHSRLRLKSDGQRKLVMTGLFKVKAHAADPNPDYLDAKLVGDEKWTDANVQGNQLKIEHIGPDNSVLQDKTASYSFYDSGGGSGGGGKCVFENWVNQVDLRGHVYDNIPSTVAGQFELAISSADKWLQFTGSSDRAYLEHRDADQSFLHNESSSFNFYDGSGGKLVFENRVIRRDKKGHVVDTQGAAGGPQFELSIKAGDEWLGLAGSMNQATIEHREPAQAYQSMTAIQGLSVAGHSLRLTSYPLSVDARGHVRSESAAENNHDLPFVGVDVITGFRIEGMELQVKTRTVYVLKAGDESEWTTVHTGTTCS